MHRSAVAFLAGLSCFVVLVAEIATAEQRPLVVVAEAAAIGLLTYAMTFALGPRGLTDSPDSTD